MKRKIRFIEIQKKKMDICAASRLPLNLFNLLVLLSFTTLCGRHSKYLQRGMYGSKCSLKRVAKILKRERAQVYHKKKNFISCLQPIKYYGKITIKHSKTLGMIMISLNFLVRLVRREEILNH